MSVAYHRLYFFTEPSRKKRALTYTNEASRNTTSPRNTSHVGPGSELNGPIQDYSSLPGPTLLKRPLGHQNRQSGFFVGTTSEHDPLIIDIYPFDKNEEY